MLKSIVPAFLALFLIFGCAGAPRVSFEPRAEGPRAAKLESPAATFAPSTRVEARAEAEVDAPQRSKEELAKKLANPVASLISVPFQFNFDRGYGPGDDGERWYVNVQPVVPFELNEEWNLISRTILPIVYQDDVVPGESEFGLGDTVQSFFFSPKEKTDGGWILGAGPVFLLPTATDNVLGADKFGIGPTGVALQQSGPWTYGVLANHIWSFAGDDDRPHVNATFVQPFVNYTTPDAISFILNSETTFDWRTDDWSMPLNGFVTKVTKIGDQTVSFGGGLRYWIDSPDGGPEGLGVRLVFTLLF